MLHLFKVPSATADLFISDLNKDEITYSVRDKETGTLLEPVKTSKFVVQGPNIAFDHIRTIHLGLANKIIETLNA